MPIGDALPPTTIVYTQTGCGPCIAVKRKLQKLGVPYGERDVTMPGIADEVVALGYTGTPVIVAPDGTSHHGYRPGKLAIIAEEA